MKHKRFMVIVLSVLVLAAVIIGIVMAGGDQQRPFKATSFEWVTEEGVIEGSDCPMFTVLSEGSGTATHLGKFTVVRRHCFTPPDHPAFDPAVGPMHDGVYTITAANGDTIHGAYSGGLEPTEFGPEGPIKGIITSPTTIDGGTGRFADAQGEYLTVGDYDLAADEGDFEMDGWISY
jgi:hypothetical protein